MAELVSQSPSIQSIYTWYRENKLYVNRRYQRKLVWTLEEKQKLIESILNKYPIPAILFAEREAMPETYEIIDGLQRLHAIMSFIETTFSTVDGDYFNLELFPTAQSHAQNGIFEKTDTDKKIGQKEVSTILDYSLALSVMRNATEEQINDVFDRINTYGHRLSDQERRQAGIQNDFSNLVRKIACNLRGDVSDEILTLPLMPSVSIDLPLTKHGYNVHADEVFWVQQGILRSTDLRDSMDEQCIADIAACVIGGSLITRSKDALDQIYTKGNAEYDRILNSVEVYGESKFSEEFNFCIDGLKSVASATTEEKLRDIVFKRRSTNPFPAVFAALHIAFHELLVTDGMAISDYTGVKSSLENLSERIEIGRGAGSPNERRKNIDTIKGLIKKHFVKSKATDHIYGKHSTVDIEGIIRRSEIELANYELKQGMLSLSNDRKIDKDVLEKIINTICAIANNGPNNYGSIIIGVTDKDQDADRISKLDAIAPKKIGKRHIVGIIREAAVLGVSVEEYFTDWKNSIKNSELSQHLKDSVLSNIDYHSFYGLGLIVFTIPPQKEPSYVGEKLYWRSGDSTEEAKTPKQVASVVRRF